MQNCDYVVVSGAARKNEKWEHTEGETVSVGGASEAEKLASDPMYRLEHSAEDRQKAEEAAPRIARIMVSCVPCPERGDREGAPIHMLMIRLETVENHRMYCLMPSENFMLRKCGTQAGIEPTTFGVPTHCSIH